jgi:hypothetical protein
MRIYRPNKVRDIAEAAISSLIKLGCLSTVASLSLMTVSGGFHLIAKADKDAVVIEQTGKLANFFAGTTLNGIGMIIGSCAIAMATNFIDDED